MVIYRQKRLILGISLFCLCQSISKFGHPLVEGVCIHLVALKRTNITRINSVIYPAALSSTPAKTSYRPSANEDWEKPEGPAIIKPDIRIPE